MEALALLVNSKNCRLCGEENENCVDIFTADENSEDLFTLINRYLPVRIEADDSYPKNICPGCHIQLQATRLFMDLIVEGQERLRKLLKAEQDHLNREIKGRQRLEQVLLSHNPNASVESYAIENDESGEKYVIQIQTDGPLFLTDHQLALKVNGLDKPKRKRGRPPKTTNVEEIPTPKDADSEDSNNAEDSVLKEAESEPPPVDPNQRQKRKIRPPKRYDGSIQGKELTKILTKEGIIDEVSPLELYESPNTDENTLSSINVVNSKEFGKVITPDGEEKALIFKPKRKSVMKSKLKS